MNKKLALVLAVIMLLVLCLTACQSTPAESSDTPSQQGGSSEPAAAATEAPSQQGGSEEPAAEPAGAGTEDAAGDSNFNPTGWPVCKEMETVQVLCSRSNYAPDDLNELYIVQQAEAITNVHIEFESYTGTTYSEKYNIILASGTYPDVISDGMSPLMQAMYGMQQGIFIPQDPYVDAYMTNLQALFDKKPALRAYISCADGKMYTLPRLNEGGWMQCGNQLIINTSWMEDLDLEMPNDLAGLETVLKAFKENDCNGNGDANDEVPLYTLLNLVGYNSGNTGLQHIFGAFGINMAPSYLDVDDDGKVYFTGIDERYKNAVAYLRKLADDGLLSTLGFSSDWDTFNAAFNQEPYVYGCFGIWEIGDGFTSPNGPIEYDFVQPLKGLNGEDPVYGIDQFPGYNYRWVITRDCEKPYVADRYADYWFQPDQSLTTIEGAIDGPNPRLIPCTVCNNGRALMVNTDVPEGMTILMFRDNNFASFFPCGCTREYYDERLHLHFTDRKVQHIDNDLKPYADKSFLPGTLNYTVEEAERVNQIVSDIRDYCNRKGVEWVSGTADIEAEWDSYINELKAMGLDDYVNHSQSAYDRFVAVMNRG